MSNEDQKLSESAYPWAQLFDLESRIARPSVVKHDRPGRPRRAYIRRRKTLMLSDEELSMLDGTELRIKEAMRPAAVTQSQVVGLALRLLHDRASKLLPDRAVSWEEIVSALFAGNGEREGD